MIGVNGMWEPDEPEADTFRQWIRDAWERLQPFSTGRTYINFQTADEDEERIRATYGANFDRLVEIKKKYDPDNLFRANRNIAHRIPNSPGNPGLARAICMTLERWLLNAPRWRARAVSLPHSRAFPCWPMSGNDPIRRTAPDEAELKADRVSA